MHCSQLLTMGTGKWDDGVCFLKFPDNRPCVPDQETGQFPEAKTGNEKTAIYGDRVRAVDSNSSKLHTIHLFHNIFLHPFDRVQSD